MPYIESEHGKAMPASPKPANLKGIQPSASVLEASGLQSSRESLAHLESLLSADVVDLCEVCDVICAMPQLESLIIRLGQSVVPGTGLKPLTVAEAAVLLGTDRLRAIVHAWPSFEPGRQQETRAESRLNGGPPGGPPGGRAAAARPFCWACCCIACCCDCACSCCWSDWRIICATSSSRKPASCAACT
jgi:hypothetical protein